MFLRLKNKCKAILLKSEVDCKGNATLNKQEAFKGLGLKCTVLKMCCLLKVTEHDITFYMFIIIINSKIFIISFLFVPLFIFKLGIYV